MFHSILVLHAQTMFFLDLLVFLLILQIQEALLFVEGKDELTDESRRIVDTVFTEIAKRPVPDVLVVPLSKPGGGLQPKFRVQLNPEVMPRLRVHDIYANVLRNHRGNGKDSASRSEATGKNTLAGINHRSAESLKFCGSNVKFLFEPTDEMNPKIDCQADEHRDESDGENIEMTDGESGVTHGITKADQQGTDCFKRASDLLVTGDKKEGADSQ